MKSNPKELQHPFTELVELGIDPEYDESDKLLRLRDRITGSTAEMPFESYNEYKNIKTLTPTTTVLPKEMQKRGIATAAYRGMEKLTGSKIVPDDSQTKMGYDFHTKHGLGKDFGMSESELESKLTPSEKMERNARKAVLSKALDSASDRYMKGGEFVANHANSMGYDKIDLMLDEGRQKNLKTVLHNAVFDAENMENPAKYIQDNKAKYLSRVKALAPLAGPALTGLSIIPAIYSGDVAAATGLENVGKGSTKLLTEKDLQDIDTLKQIREEDQLKPSSFNKLRNILNKK